MSLLDTTDQGDTTEPIRIDDELEHILDPLPPSAKLVAKTLEEQGEAKQATIIEETLLIGRTTRYALSRLDDAGVIESYPSLEDPRQMVYRLRKPNGNQNHSRGDDPESTE